MFHANEPNCSLSSCDIDTHHLAAVCLAQEIRPTKVLGILCMIDEGEADWKVVTIDAEDKWAPFLNG